MGGGSYSTNNRVNAAVASAAASRASTPVFTDEDVVDDNIASEIASMVEQAYNTGDLRDSVSPSLIPKDLAYDPEYQNLSGWADSRIPPMIWDASRKMSVPNPAYVAPDYSGLENWNALVQAENDWTSSNLLEITNQIKQQETEKYDLIPQIENFNYLDPDPDNVGRGIYLDEANRMIKDFGVSREDAEQWYSDILEFTEGRSLYAPISPELSGLAKQKTQMKDEGYANKTNAWFNELDGLKQQDPASFTSSFDEMPIQSKLQYLYSTYEKGELSKEEYKENFKNTVNASYDPQLNPNTKIIIDIKGNDYLVDSQSVFGKLTDPFFLINGSFYADDSLYFPSEDMSEGAWLQTIGTGQKSAENKLENLLEPSTAGFFLNNPVTQIASLAIPGFAQAAALVKAAAGETMHASDLFAAVGGYDLVSAKFGELAEGLGASAGAATGSAIFADAVTKGSLNAVTALITDQDPLEAFLIGGVQVGVGRVLDKVNELTNGSMDALLNGDGAVVSEDTRVFNAEGEVISGTPAVYAGNIAYDLISEGIASQLATGEIDEVRMANIISAAAITSETVGNLVGERLPPGGIEMLTRSLQSTLTAAASGGSGSDAFQRSMAVQLERAVGQALQNNTFAEDVAELWDRASGDYGTLYAQVDAADEAAENRAEAARQVNDANQAITEGADNLAALAETANGIRDGRDIGELNAEEVNAYDAAMDAYNEAEDALTTALNDQYLPTIEAGQEAYDAATDAYNAAVETYESTRDNMSEASQEATADIAPLMGEVNQATVTNLNPNFDADFYAEQHGLAEGEDAYAHYLSEGLYNNLPANQTALTAQNTVTVNNALNDLAASTGIDLTRLSPEQMKDVVQRLEQVAQGEGVSLEDLNVASIAQNALSVINNPDGTGEEFFSMTTDADGNVTSFEYGSSSAGFNRAEGVTNQDILNGSAIAQVNPETGEYEWSIPPQQTYVSNDQIYQFDEETGQPYRTNENGEREDVALIDVTDIDPFTSDAAPTLQDLADKDSPAYNPEAFTEELNNSATVDDAGNPVADESWADWLLDALQDGATYLQGDEDTAPASEAAQNAYANGIRATAGIIESFNGFATAFGSDPAGTAAGKFAADMAKIGEGANTAGYQEAVGAMREFQKSLQTRDDPNTPIVYDENGEYVSGDESKKSLWEGAQGIFKTAANHPAAFFGEYISVDFMEEGAPLLVGGLATILGRGAAKVLGSGLTKELAEEAAQAIGKKAGLTAAAATDVAESWGGTAGGAYADGHATFMKMAGKEADILELSGPARDAFLAAQDIKAREYALKLAIDSGNVAAVLTVGSLAVGGMALEKLFINGKPPEEFAGLFNEIARRIETGAELFVKEGVPGSFEEGGATAFTQGRLSLLDPDIDVMGDVGAAAALGFIVEGTISSGIYSIASTGDLASDILISNNPEALEALNNSENYSREELQSQLNTFLGDSQAATDAMNFLYDEVYTSTAEATDALEQLGLPYTPEDIVNTTGETPDADLDATLAEYWALTYGTDTDTDGDSIPDVQDPEPDSPSTVGIEVDPDTGDTTYIDDEGYITVVDTNEEATQYNPDGTPVADTDVVDEVIDEDVVDEVIDEDVVDEVVDEDVVDEVIDEDVVDEVVDEDVVDEVIDEDVVDEVIDEDVVDEVVDEDVVDEVIDEDVV